MKTRLQDLLDAETLKKLTETKRVVKEANPDGTISKDEDKLMDKLNKQAEKDTTKLCKDLKKQAEKIGGSFRSPAYKARIKDTVKALVDYYL